MGKMKRGKSFVKSYTRLVTFFYLFSVFCLLDFVLNFHRSKNLVKMMQENNFVGFFDSFVFP